VIPPIARRLLAVYSRPVNGPGHALVACPGPVDLRISVRWNRRIRSRPGHRDVLCTLLQNTATSAGPGRPNRSATVIPTPSQRAWLQMCGRGTRSGTGIGTEIHLPPDPGSSLKYRFNLGLREPLAILRSWNQADIRFSLKSSKTEYTWIPLLEPDLLCAVARWPPRLPFHARHQPRHSCG